jgi:hypothetical protein
MKSKERLCGVMEIHVDLFLPLSMRTQMTCLPPTPRFTEVQMKHYLYANFYPPLRAIFAVHCVHPQTLIHPFITSNTIGQHLQGMHRAVAYPGKC